MYKVQKGVPLPRPKKYPLDEMEVFDSFAVSPEHRNKIATAANRLKPKRFSTRTVYEDGKKVCRIWRIA